MKLTWFGGSTIRIHIGGSILVIDPETAPEGIDPAEIDPAELVSGADRIVSGFGRELPFVDLGVWRPRKPQRLLDETEHLPDVEIWSAGAGTILVDAVGEPPLLLLSSPAPELGRWADAAIAVLFGDGAAIQHIGSALLADRPPRLLALAADEQAADLAIAALHDRLDGAGLVALQPRMALEV